MPLVVVAALGSVLGGCGGVHAAKGGVVYRVAPGRGLSAATFAEVDFKGVGVLADVRTGREIRTLLPARRGKLQLVDLARDGKNALVATYSTGPRCTSGVAGCGPKPGTCGAQVVRLDPAAGRLTQLTQFGRDTQVVATRPNPAGTELAMLVAPCVPSYFNQHIEVLRIADGATWSMGATPPRCHSLGPPAWVHNGAGLLMSYGAAIGNRPYKGADGTCSQSQPSALLEVPAQSGQPGLTGIRRPDTPHCSYSSVASQGSAVYAISVCATYRHTAPDVLEKLDSALHPVGHWTVGQCEDGDSLALNPSGHVLLSAYLFCNPPLKGHKSGEPTTDLDLLAHNRIHHLTHATGGDLVYSSLAW
jgi:hypothetical protein